jgi:pyruvate dehydrogenase E1 component beta subunit
VIGVNIMVKKALEAAEQLAKDGLSVEVIDPRTLVPLDKDTLIQSVAKTSRVVIAYEGHQRAGAGAEIAAMLAEEAVEYLDGPVMRVAAKNVPLPYSPDLENYVLPDTADIVTAIRSFWS